MTQAIIYVYYYPQVINRSRNTEIVQTTCCSALSQYMNKI